MSHNVKVVHLTSDQYIVGEVVENRNWFGRVRDYEIRSPFGLERYDESFDAEDGEDNGFVPPGTFTVVFVDYLWFTSDRSITISKRGIVRIYDPLDIIVDKWFAAVSQKTHHASRPPEMTFQQKQTYDTIQKLFGEPNQ